MVKKTYLVTGAAGFIGFHLSSKILSKGFRVIGVDNLNNYYDTRLKKSRTQILKKKRNFTFKKVDIKNYNSLEIIFRKFKFDAVIHLAAQAGVRYSLVNPKSYIDNNIKGFFNILDVSKNYKVKKFIYASTSSIYGIQKKYPLKEKFETNNPIQLYAATKNQMR